MLTKSEFLDFQNSFLAKTLNLPIAVAGQYISEISIVSYNTENNVADVELIWAAEEYTITFKSSACESVTRTYLYGDTYNAVEIEELTSITGYAFKSWEYDNRSFTLGSVVGDLNAYIGDKTSILTFIAEFTPKQKTIYFYFKYCKVNGYELETEVVQRLLTVDGKYEFGMANAKYNGYKSPVVECNNLEMIKDGNGENAKYTFSLPANLYNYSSNVVFKFYQDTYNIIVNKDGGEFANNIDIKNSYNISETSFVLPELTIGTNYFKVWSVKYTDTMTIQEYANGAEISLENHYGDIIVDAKWLCIDQKTETITDEFARINITNVFDKTYVIKNTVDFIVIIGDYIEKSIGINVTVDSRSDLLNIKLYNVNFVASANMSGIDAGNCAYLNIEAVGVNKIESGSLNVRGISTSAIECQNLNLTGDRLTLVGGSVEDTCHDMVNGSCGIGNSVIPADRYNMTINMIVLTSTGGLGGKGTAGTPGELITGVPRKAKNGEYGVNGKHGNDGTDGGFGGYGGNGLSYFGSVLIIRGKVTVAGGKGGDGGDGGNGSDGQRGGEGGDSEPFVWGKRGGNGGDGGNGGNSDCVGGGGKGFWPELTIVTGSITSKDGSNGDSGTAGKKGSGGAGGLGGFKNDHAYRYDTGAPGADGYPGR